MTKTNKFEEQGFWNLGIPTYKNGEWVDDTVFENKKEFVEFVENVFKEPGEYEFDDTALEFNSQAKYFDKNGAYCLHAFKTKDYINYWNREKDKCRRGVIFISGPVTWYLTRDYYMWVNFLQIYDKLKKRFMFPEVWDVHYHISLYELLAELHGKDAAIVKKRQIGSSWLHAAKLINEFWFEEGSVLKMGGYNISYVDLDGTWDFLEKYANFLNNNTGWYRPRNPNKVGNWIQKITVRKNGRDVEVGNQSRITHMSFERSPTKGVGGSTKYFFYEEAGIAPTMDKTKIYMESSVEMGDISTGMFIAAGSVGELTHCEPLKEMIFNPDRNNIYAVPNKYYDDTGTIHMTGLFIPEQWSMPPYIDDYGNSLVEKALESLDRQYTELRETMLPDLFQLRISQRPRTLKEAFDYREVSFFPSDLLIQQEERINDNQYPVEYVDLERDTKTGDIIIKKSKSRPIMKFPVDKKMENKEGVICLYKRPNKKPKWGRFIASIDPVAVGKTVQSDSLCSIYVYELPVEETVKSDDSFKTKISGGQIVCSWAGRFDDVFDTYRRLELIIELFNAWTLIESNISGFVTFMIGKNKQYYFIPKDQVVFLKEVSAKSKTFYEFGWRNVGSIFKDHIRHYLRDYMTEVVDEIVDENGEIERKIYGIETIPDIMAIVEMKAYKDGMNVDRIISLAALIAFVRIYIANRGYIKVDVEEESETSNDVYNVDKNIFNHLGNNNVKNFSYIRSKGGFKNLR